MSGDYDVIVIGAGIGGLTAASILAKEGSSVAILERENRVGGRALSIEGREISERGSSWYQELLKRHYCYLAHSEPGIEIAVQDRLLNGYTIDLGYHGVACAGMGYFAKLTDYLSVQVQINGCDTGFYYQGLYYEEPRPGDPHLDEKLKRICEEKGIDYWSFANSGFIKTPDELDELEKVSLYDYCQQLGLTADDVVWQSYKCAGILFATINNPHDISVGEMLRYTNDIILPLILAGKEVYGGGFAQGGIMQWSQAVASEFERLGGTLYLAADVKKVMVEEGEVAGVSVILPGADEMVMRSSKVVSSIPVPDTFEVVDAQYFPEDFVSRVRALYGYGGVAPYFGLNELPIPLEQVRRLIKTPVVVAADGDYDADIYMSWCVQSAIDPTCAPEGKYLLTTYLPLTEEESRDESKVMKVVKAVPEFLESVYPGFKDCVEWALYPTCWKLEGVAKSVSQAGTLKPKVKAPGIDGLYFSGDTARGFGVAMDCACSAGINCAAAILGRDLGII